MLKSRAKMLVKSISLPIISMQNSEREEVDRYSYPIKIRLSLQELKHLRRSNNCSVAQFCREATLNAIANSKSSEWELERGISIIFYLDRKEIERANWEASNRATESFCREAILLQSSIKNQLLVTQRQVRIEQKIKIFSTVCLVLGGLLVASNTSVSGFGFLFLASSSSSMALACFLAAEKWNGLFFLLTFSIVDCFGIFNWLIRG